MDLVRNIKLSQIQTNPYQPRTVFDQQKLEELAESIKKDGLIQPVVLRKTASGYEIVAGERRCRAAQIAGLTVIPAIISNMDDYKSARIALIENIQREDLNPLEEAEAYSQLLQMEGCTQEELAKRLGKSQSAIANKMRLLNLPTLTKTYLEEGRITERQARALLSVPADKQEDYLKQITELKLDSAATENLVKGITPAPRKKRAKTKRYIRDIRIALNTVNETVKNLNNSNLTVYSEQEDTDEEVIVHIHIKKP